MKQQYRSFALLVLILVLAVVLSGGVIYAQDIEITEESPVVNSKSEETPTNSIELEALESHNDLVLGIVQSLSVAVTIISSILGGLYFRGKTVAQTASGKFEDVAMKLMEVVVTVTKESAEASKYVRESILTLGYKVDESGMVSDPSRSVPIEEPITG